MDKQGKTNLQPPQTGDSEGSIPFSIKSMAFEAQNTLNKPNKI